MNRKEAFFTVHRDLPREGPGTAADVFWALGAANTPAKARICDAACGPGADTMTLAEARPLARIDAIDLQPDFVRDAHKRTHGFGSRVQVYERDYNDLPDKYDLIWCAGALYFQGFDIMLRRWRSHLRPGGAVAFSEPAWVSDPPGEGAQAFWADYPAITTEAALKERIAAAGWRVEDRRWLIGAPWEAYYKPLRARLDMLVKEDASPALAEAMAEHAREIALWDAARDEIAYVLFVVRPA